MASTRRAHKIADTIWRELAYVLKRSIADPRLQTVTVTGVDVSADLRHARIFVAMLDIENRDDMMKALQKASPFIRKTLSQSMALRVVPVLHFYFDESIERGAKLASLMNELAIDDVEAENEDPDPEQENPET